MDWKDKLLQNFIPDLEPKAWVVSDPNAIVRNEQILAQLTAKGFEITFFEDPIEFRYEYETRIRPTWERGEKTPFVVIFDERAQGFEALPSDLLQLAHRLEFGLEELFPNLDADVLAELSPEMWTQLEEYAAKQPGKVYRAKETEELALRICHRMVPDLIDAPIEFIRRLTDTHRSNLPLSSKLALRLDKELKQKEKFADWPIVALAENSTTFWHFIQERWDSFVMGQSKAGETESSLTVGGPIDLPFEDPLIRGYVEALLEEGLLESVDLGASNVAGNPWWRIGTKSHSHGSDITADRLSKLASSIPGNDPNYRNWINFGLRYSKAVSQVFRTKDNALKEQFWGQLWDNVDKQFSEWLKTGYSTLHNLPSAPPVMVHHIPKQLLRWKKQGEKIALLVLDGLSCSGWYTIRDSLLEGLTEEIELEESAAFTWLPSLTPVCRQSLFSGLTPRLLAETLDRTDKDGPRWTDFWESNGSMLARQIYHNRIDGQPTDWDRLPDFESTPALAMGITVSQPDEIMHGMTLGWTGWHQQLELWMSSGFLPDLVNRLIKNGFTVCISADHGNLEAIGTGKIQEGVLAENRGQRVRVYPNASLREAALKSHEGVSTVCESAMLPENRFPIFATGRGAFVQDGDLVVSHGGNSFDELLVPWVTLRRKQE